MDTINNNLPLSDYIGYNILLGIFKQKATTHLRRV